MVAKACPTGVCQAGFCEVYLHVLCIEFPMYLEMSRPDTLYYTSIARGLCLPPGHILDESHS